MVALLIAIVEIPIQPLSTLITPSKDLKGHQDSPINLSRVPKKFLASANPSNTPLVLSKVPAKTPLVSPNPSYTLEVLSRVLAEKSLVPPNISKSPILSSSISELPIDPSRVLETPLVPLIHPSITTKGDLGPQRLTPQIKHKYKIFLEYEAFINFLSLTIPSVTYSRLFASSLSSFFKSLSNNVDISLATNLDSPSISGLIESIIAKKKNAQKKAKLAAVTEKKAAIATKKATAVKTRKVQAAARKAEIVA